VFLIFSFVIDYSQVAWIGKAIFLKLYWKIKKCE